MGSLADRLLVLAVPPLAHAHIRLLWRTLRVEFRNREVIDRLRARPSPYILAFWHSRFLMMPYAYPGGRMAVLSSRHRDSRMLVAVLGRFGLATAWGSSTEGGAAGLRQLLRFAREGYDLAFTPDGPRGPRRRVKPGVITAARLTGLPIVPVTFAASRARRLRSWDRTLVPRAFARGVFVYGEPLTIGRAADAVEQERCRLALEQALDELTDAADRTLGLEPEPPAEPVAASAS
jgi:lysophospholipid acyltransferase (LPLAT)-like uncharacterized protein